MELVLLHCAPLQVVDRSCGVHLSSPSGQFLNCATGGLSTHFHGEVRRRERPLLPLQDVEVIIGRMPARVSLRSNWRSEYDKILGDAGVYYIHGAHSTAGVVEDPLFHARIDVRQSVFPSEIGGDERHHRSCIIAVLVDCRPGQAV